MNKDHAELLRELKRHRGSQRPHPDKDSYISSGHSYYDVSVPVRRQIAKDWLKGHGDISGKEFIALLDSLYVTGKSHEEKTLASLLLGYHSSARESVGPKQLDRWLDHLVGWAEVDSLCQNTFTADEVLADWKRWEPFLKRLERSKNINKRRAALVFLTGPTRRSVDPRLRDRAFAAIDALSHERDIRITKAISWLLRDLSGTNKAAVARYLGAHADELPKIAIRETRRKLETGRKT